MFMPGQWVDFHIPGVSVVGGFSICSTPQQLQHDGYVELCVKKSNHPPAKWLHESAAAGNEIQLQIGGDFAYDHEQLKNVPVVLMAGGVGITPLISMVRTRLSMQESEQRHNSSSIPHSTTLIYSAKTAEDLLYREELQALAQSHPSFALYLSATKGSGGMHAPDGSWKPNEINAGRVPLQLLRDALSATSTSDALSSSSSSSVPHLFLCGPPVMVDELLPLAQQCVPNENVHKESWW